MPTYGCAKIVATMTAVAAAVVVEEEVVVVTIAIGKLSIYAYTYMI